MKSAILAAFLCVAAVFSATAQIYTTNPLALATYSAGTNASVQFNPPQSHTIQPQTVQMYHSASNVVQFPGYVLAQVSFDGGVTWANVASNAFTTNYYDYFSVSQSSASATNRFLIVTTTNQTLYLNASWRQ